MKKKVTYLKLSIVCVSSFGIRFSFANVGPVPPSEKPLLLKETSKPPNPLLTLVVDDVGATDAPNGLVPNKFPLGALPSNAIKIHFY